jgi:hypothetical protein
MAPRGTDIHVRLPPDLAAKLKDMADEECRSISRQAEHLLRQSLRKETFPRKKKEAK